MDRRKKITSWVTGGIAAFLILLLLSLLYLPRLMNLESLKGEILADISKDVGGQIQARQMEISFLIRPQLIFHQVSLSIPGKVDANAEFLSVYPKILPLLMGKVEPGKVKAENPQIDLTIRKKVAKESAVEKSVFFDGITERLVHVFDAMQSRVIDMVVIVTNGELNVSQGQATPFHFEEIRARFKLSSDTSKLNLSCTSNLWKNLHLKARLGPADQNGQLDVVNFQPQSLLSFLLPRYSNLLGESVLELGVEFEADESTGLHAEIAGSIPLLTLHRASDKLELKGEKFKAGLHMDKSGTTVSLNKLVLENPELGATGEFRWDRDQQQMTLQIEGSGVDVDSTRKAARAMAGGLETTKDIFTVLQGGRVPFISFSGRGTSFAELGQTKNFRIEGRITQGNIFIPGPDIELQEVSGNAVISNGILEGQNVSARLGNSTGREGTLKLGLQGEDAPFHLEVLALVDLADLPPILKKVVKNEFFLQEIGEVENLEGRAQGTLVLGESTNSIEARAHVSQFNLAAQYRHIPFPVKISGGRFIYDKTEISVENVRAELVESSFSGISGWFRWTEAPQFQIHAGDSSVAFDEIYSCLAATGIAEFTEKTQEVKGTVALSDLSLQGPLLNPQNWQVDMTGKVEHVTINTSALGLSIVLTGGTFRSAKERTEHKLSLQDVVVSALDSSLKVSGVISNYLNEANRVDIRFQGEMGPQANGWLADFIDLPTGLHLNSPFSVSEARLIWKKKAETSFTGKINGLKGAQLSVDIVQKPEELIIKRIDIQDKNSTASLGLTLNHKKISIDFSGQLAGKTFVNFLQKNRIFKGRIQGDFQADFFLNNPVRSRATGSLSGKELAFEFAENGSLEVEHFSLEGVEKGIRVHSAVCNWYNSRMNLKGKVNFSKGGYVLDSALMVDRLEWDRLTGLFQQPSGKNGVEQTGKFWHAPVAADVDVTAEEFAYAGLTWSNVKAHVYLSSHKIHAVITRAEVCGIATPGVVEKTPQGFFLAFKPVTADQDLASTVSCLANKEGIASGTFDLKGVVTAGKNGDVMRSLDGNIEFVSREGQLRRASPSSALQQTFDLLDDAEAFEGEVPNLEKEGLAYKTITVRGTMRNGELLLEEATINGVGINMAFLGKVDLVGRKLDLELLVSPLNTVDALIGKVPLVGSILGGHLITIPIKVEGDMASPRVTPLHPASVAKGLLRLLKRTVTLPVTVIQPLLPRQDQEKEQQEQKEKDQQDSQHNIQK